MTPDILTEIGFEFKMDPYMGRTWIYPNNPTITYHLESNTCRANLHEYSIITKICKSKEDIQKFIECIKFLSTK